MVAVTPAETLRAAAGLLREPACGMRQDAAEILADWLTDAERDMAAAEGVGSKRPDAADLVKYCDEPDSVRRALAFARTILGRQP